MLLTDTHTHVAVELDTTLFLRRHLKPLSLHWHSLQCIPTMYFFKDEGDFLNLNLYANLNVINRARTLNKD